MQRDNSPELTAPAKPRKTRPRGDAPGATRGRILAAAERLFAQQGYDGVTMPQIAAASGITAGAIYKHFDSKAELFFQVVRGVVQATAVSQREGGADQATLPAVVARYTTRPLKRLRQLAVEMHYASGRHPKVRQLLRRSLEVEVRQIGDGLSAAYVAARREPPADIDLRACAVMVFLMGLMHMETLLPHLVGDARWRAFVENGLALALGLPAPATH